MKDNTKEDQSETCGQHDCGCHSNEHHPSTQLQEPDGQQPSAEKSEPSLPLTTEELLAQEKLKSKSLEEEILRMRADFDNFRKRIIKEKDESLKYANESLLMDLFPVLDNFELGMMAAETATDPKIIAQGFSMVRSQLQRFLSDLNVSEIDAQGQKFDPNLHEAVSEEASDKLAEGFVLYQKRKGYRLKDRLLRPATVVVSKGIAKDETSADGNSTQDPALKKE